MSERGQAVAFLVFTLFIAFVVGTSDYAAWELENQPRPPLYSTR